MDDEAEFERRGYATDEDDDETRPQHPARSGCNGCVYGTGH